ncbi:MAG TPA: hypothetical protein VF624_03665 [Tepidisphaeraceae bacterium]|jgi:hypothetical protein
MRIIVAGYIIGYPLGGMTWHHLNYVAGLHAMGHEVWFYEDSGQWLVPYNPVTGTCENDPAYGIAYLKAAFAAAGLPLRYCYRSELLDEYFGLSRSEWHALIKRADLLICVSGVTPWRDEFRQARRTCVIDTDPVFTQLRMRNDADFLTYYKQFDRVATFGNLIGTPLCPLPTSGLDWIGTNQPIALEQWPLAKPRSKTFSTIGKWEHTADRGFEFEGRHYASSKGVEWAKLVDLPSRTNWRLEMAMSALPEATRHDYESHGWHFTDPTSASLTASAFGDFIRGHSGELTVAKQIYAGLPSGWFSDRSAAFLASGRPVITQASGFEQWLPTGEGLFSFAAVDDAAAALETIGRDYDRHAAAARDIAEKHFDARRVLGGLIERII